MAYYVFLIKSFVDKKRITFRGDLFREYNNVKLILGAFVAYRKIKFKYITVTKLIPEYFQINGLWNRLERIVVVNSAKCKNLEARCLMAVTWN